MFQTRWVDSDAKAFIKRHAEKGINAELALRVYTSQLIGSDPDLVMHGGGNT
jgi:rhamnose utilization protein RhaD (predicted bifunctional aldolase and dehydrogenase)